MNQDIFSKRMNLLQAQAPVVIFTIETCPYCIRAKSALELAGYDYVNIDVSMNSSTVNTILSKYTGTKISTVPQVFMKNEYIGGCDKLLAWLSERGYKSRVSKGVCSKRFDFEKLFA